MEAEARLGEMSHPPQTPGHSSKNDGGFGGTGSVHPTLAGFGICQAHRRRGVSQLFLRSKKVLGVLLLSLGTAKGASVTITRDDWGIAHIRGSTDADAVYGMIYAQAEDDFSRIEHNYLVALGRLAEADGASAVPSDLRARLFIDEGALKTKEQSAPTDLRALLRAWADGLNHYLATHPATKPRVLTHFEPWMPLAFSEGSIGGDIESINLNQLAHFYLPEHHASIVEPLAQIEPGSNGIAVAPKLTANGHALLLINPHTSFYFRSELQMASDEGLNAYGAATWGQFFLYQGFNEHLGWMHTSTTADAVDVYRETIRHDGAKLEARFGASWRPITERDITVTVRGETEPRRIRAYFTIHGPVIGAATNGEWLSVALMQKPVEALEQGFALTKAHDWAQFQQAMRFQANSSNNTVYADADGHIAYLHPQFLPRRNDRFDYTNPVDGADPATAWQGEHALSELPQLFDPPTGFIQNTNNAPWTAAGAASPRQADYPRYADTEGQNMRGIHALALLQKAKSVDRLWLLHTAYDSALPGFDILLPPLLRAFDTLPVVDKRRTELAEPIARLRTWNRHWSADSIATGLAVSYGESLWLNQHGGAPTLLEFRRLAATSAPLCLFALQEAVRRLDADFGTWRTPWREQNRLQRLDDAISPHFSDMAPSLSVPFTAGKWGSLASVAGPGDRTTHHRFGTSGNSFVAVVEFGPRVAALAVSAGGESGDPVSRHFNDQASRFAAGNLRPAYFYPDELARHAERTYTP